MLNKCRYIEQRNLELYNDIGVKYFMDINILANYINSIQDIFNENELAYLSLTSKNELVIRDKIAYKLHKELKDHIVSREYSPSNLRSSRIDLAILKDSQIIDLIEFKSMYTFDALNKFEKYIDAVVKDFEKNKPVVNERMNQYGVIIATHPKSIPNLKYREYVKYYDFINRNMKKVEKGEELIEIMDNSIRAEFDNENYDIKQCKLKAGVAFDVEVDIYIWIIQKFSKIEFK